MSWTRSRRRGLAKTDSSKRPDRADIPQAQKQEAVAIDLSKDGNILLYGSPDQERPRSYRQLPWIYCKQSPENLTMYLLILNQWFSTLDALPHAGR